MSIKDGGPAYPVPNSANQNGQEGMSLRDHFAGLAMAAIIASSAEGTSDSDAKAAYIYADAMLRAREAGQ